MSSIRLDDVLAPADSITMCKSQLLFDILVLPLGKCNEVQWPPLHRRMDPVRVDICVRSLIYLIFSHIVAALVYTFLNILLDRLLFRFSPPSSSQCLISTVSPTHLYHHCDAQATHLHHIRPFLLLPLALPATSTSVTPETTHSRLILISAGFRRDLGPAPPKGFGTRTTSF